jgi:glycosyltransferase involved in cell wall biosynthesis
VGDGEIRGELAAQASRLGIADRVVFHGSISDPDRLLPIFARAFAYVSPDNVGLGVLHAFAYGVPVITSAPRATARVGFRHGPEFRNLRHLENSIVFDAADGLQGPLLAILSQKGLARKLGRQAYADYRSKRSISAMAEGIEAAVEDRANTAQAAVGG